MKKNVTGGLRRNMAVMLPMMLVTEVGKRLGFGKQIAQFAIKRMRSSMLEVKAFGDYEPGPLGTAHWIPCTSRMSSLG